jgi:tetratricopeptide (TPR) repeat protein
MKNFISWSFFFFAAVLFVGGLSPILASELPAKGSSEALFKKAEELKENGDYSGAGEILKQLTDANADNGAYQISYVDVLLEQSRILKEAGSAEWKTMIKEAGSKIKAMRSANAGNPDYYLVYAKYSWIAEAKRDAHIHKALEKAFYYKPGYVDAFILKGDINADLARTAQTEMPQDSTTMTGGSNPTTRHFISMEAKSAYQSALSVPDISSRKKAYVYFRMGELEDKLMGNKADAKVFWEKAANLAPESKAGGLARARLGK